MISKHFHGYGVLVIFPDSQLIYMDPFIRGIGKIMAYSKMINVHLTRRLGHKHTEDAAERCPSVNQRYQHYQHFGLRLLIWRKFILDVQSHSNY